MRKRFYFWILFLLLIASVGLWFFPQQVAYFFNPNRDLNSGAFYLADQDEDGIVNSLDNCWNISNPDQKVSYLTNEEIIEKRNRGEPILGDACADKLIAARENHESFLEKVAALKEKWDQLENPIPMVLYAVNKSPAGIFDVNQDSLVNHDDEIEVSKCIEKINPKGMIGIRLCQSANTPPHRASLRNAKESLRNVPEKA